MIIVFFPAGSRAGTLEYLLHLRAERVVAAVGDELSFALFAREMRTNNPVLAGALCWSEEIAPQLAVEVTLRFLREWLLGGMDPVNVPAFIAVHREPLLGEIGVFRTAAHFSVFNFHLGLAKTLRLYSHWRDFRSLVGWQETVNATYGWTDPGDSAPWFRFAAAPKDQELWQYWSLCREVIDCWYATSRAPDISYDLVNHLHEMVLRFQSDPSQWLPDADLSRLPATILVHETPRKTSLSIRLADGICIRLGASSLGSGTILPSTRRKAPARRLSAPELGALDAKLRALGAARREALVAAYGPAAFDPVAVSTAVRAFVGGAVFRVEATQQIEPADAGVQSNAKFAQGPDAAGAWLAPLQKREGPNI